MNNFSFSSTPLSTSQISFSARPSAHYLVCISPARWRCRIAPTVYLVALPQGPNVFHRFMQRIVFGFVWERMP